jgi:hypothetical protein
MIRMTNLKEFKNMLIKKKKLDLMNMEEGCTWYSSTQLTFVEILFKVNV